MWFYSTWLISNSKVRDQNVGEKLIFCVILITRDMTSALDWYLQNLTFLEGMLSFGKHVLRVPIDLEGFPKKSRPFLKKLKNIPDLLSDEKED